jgi:hypothetical protein
MKLRDNPVFRYGVRIYWRGWRLWILPGITLVVLAAGFVLAYKYNAPLTHLMSTGGAAPPGFPPGFLRNIAWVYFASLPGMLMTYGAMSLLPALVPGILAKEFDHRTWDSLRLTSLTDTDIAVGKLCAVLLPSGICLLVSIPIVVLAISVGNAPAGQIAYQYGQGLVMTVTYAVVALWMAAWMRKTAPAIGLSYVATIVGIPMVMLAMMVILAIVPAIIYWDRIVAFFNTLFGPGSSGPPPSLLMGSHPGATPGWAMVVGGVQAILLIVIGIFAWRMLILALHKTEA